MDDQHIFSFDRFQTDITGTQQVQTDLAAVIKRIPKILLDAGRIRKTRHGPVVFDA